MINRLLLIVVADYFLLIDSRGSHDWPFGEINILLSAPAGGDDEYELCQCDIVCFFSDDEEQQTAAAQIRSFQSDLILIFVSLNVSGVFMTDDTRRHPSCEHAEAETVLKCVKHLELIFIPGKRRNIQTLFV